ncbi:hypothetical protein Cgig2_003090 [Carnegiea gigantea]|uniref:Uncharacterized protein n=1 Tax=Carnegiea gigantea TaxID=171969 RepID=A0A9Q1JLD1_9CARY|nr:hypothetical protein Cgig2_003090 [Carnegiea gigantea]
MVIGSRLTQRTSPFCFSFLWWWSTPRQTVGCSVPAGQQRFIPAEFHHHQPSPTSFLRTEIAAFSLTAASLHHRRDHRHHHHHDNIQSSQENGVTASMGTAGEESSVEITCFTEVLEDATVYFQIIRLNKQIYAWIGCNSAKLGPLYAAAPTRPNNTVSVTSIVGGTSDNTGSGIARRLDWCGEEADREVDQYGIHQTQVKRSTNTSIVAGQGRFVKLFDSWENSPLRVAFTK